MPEPLLRASIKRHLPFLTHFDKQQLDATKAERNATERTKEIAQRMGVRMPGQAR